MLLKFTRILAIFGINAYLILLVLYLLLRLIFGDRFWPLSFLNNFIPFYFLPLLILLPLAFILHAQRTLAFALILTAIGAAWFAPRFLPRAQAAPPGMTLKVLTFNTWGNGNDRGITQKEAWIREVNADLVLLQEMSTPAARESQSRLADTYPYQFIHFEANGTRANLTLSRYPILETSNSNVGASDAPLPERIVIDANGHIIVIYNAHMIWPANRYPRYRLPRQFRNYYLRVALSYSDAPRNAQIRNFLQIIDREQFPVIVAGDFNTSDYSLMYQEIASHLRDSFAEAGYGFGASWPNTTFLGLPDFIPPLIRIDYIWHSHHFQTVRAEQGPRLYSDHIPLVATLVLAD